MPGLGTILGAAEKTILQNSAKVATKDAARASTVMASKSTPLASAAVRSASPVAAAARSGAGLFSKITSRLGGAASSAFGTVAGAAGAGNIPALRLLSGLAGSSSGRSSSSSYTSPRSDSTPGSGFRSSSSQDSTSYLRIISSDISEMKATTDQIYSFLQHNSDKKESGGGGIFSMLGAGLSAISGNLLKYLAPLGGAILGLAPKIGSAVMSALKGLMTGAMAVGSKIKGVLGKAFGKEVAEEGAEAVAKSAAKTVYRNPKTGKFMSKSAYEAMMKASGETAETVGKVAAKEGSELAIKEGGKIGAKTLGKSVLKKIPGIGLIAGLGFGAQRAWGGDYLGAGGEVLSGALSTLPGLGTAGSIAVDAALAGRDIYKATNPVDSAGPSVTSATGANLAKLKAQNDALREKDSTIQTSQAAEVKQDEKDKKNAMLTGSIAAAAPTDQLEKVNDTLEKILDQFQKGEYAPEKPGQYPGSDLPKSIEDNIDPFSNQSSGKKSSMMALPMQTGNFEKDLLNVIGTAESGKKGDEGYDVQFKGAKVKANKPLTEMTIGEIQAHQKAMLKGGSKSSAIGRYQFISSTFNSVAKQLGLDPNQKFDKETQDKMALALLNQGGRLDKFKSGRLSKGKFENYISSQWASVYNTSGRGAYDGDGLNKAYASVSPVLNGYTTKSSELLNNNIKESNNSIKPTVIVAPPTTNQSSSIKGGGSTVSTPAAPVIVRNPDSAVRLNVNKMISTS